MFFPLNGFFRLALLVASFHLSLLPAAASEKEASPDGMRINMPKSYLSFGSRMRFHLVKTGVNKLQLTVKNKSEKNVFFRLKADRYKKNGFDPLNVRFSSEKFSIAPRSSVSIQYELAVPKDHSGSGVFRVSFDVLKKESRIDGSVILEDSVVAFNVSDTVRHKLSVQHSVKTKFGRPVVKMKIKNGGDGIIYGIKAVSIILKADSRGKISQNSASDRFALAGPGKFMELETSFKGRLPPGKYILLTILTSHSDPSAKATQEHEFVVR